MVNKFKNCPRCSSHKVVRNGYNRKQIQRLVCKNCGKHFQAKYTQFSRQQMPCKLLIERLLDEKISLRGIARNVGASASGVLNWAEKFWAKIPENLNIDWSLISPHYTEIQIDEFWTYYFSKQNRLWLLVARCVESGQIIAYHLGRRNRSAVRALLQKIPLSIHKNAFYFTDDWAPFAAELPSDRHYIGKEWTHELEGAFSGFRQRDNRLARKTVGFSKSYDNHVLSIRSTIARYNLSAQT